VDDSKTRRLSPRTIGRGLAGRGRFAGRTRRRRLPFGGGGFPRRSCDRALPCRFLRRCLTRETKALVLGGFSVGGQPAVHRRPIAAGSTVLIRQRSTAIGLHTTHLGQALTPERDDIAAVADEPARRKLVPPTSAARIIRADRVGR